MAVSSKLQGTESDDASLQAAVERVAKRLEEAQLCFGHGTDNAWDEAVALVAHVLALPPDEPIDASQLLSQSQRAAIDALVRRRIDSRRPLAYLTGRARFAGLDLICDHRALVPRSPLAELIEDGFAPWLEMDSVNRILDLCTGGGAIALACAHYFAGARVDATDLSDDALALAAANASQLGLADRLRLFSGDLFEPLPNERYDLIVSNPPYVPEGQVRGLPAEYGHEPALGLAAGKNGLAIVDRILHQAPHFLNERGILVVEVGETWESVARSYPQLPFTWLEFSRGGEGVFLLERSHLSTLEVRTS